MESLRACVAMLLLAGCASASGVKITEDQLIQLKSDKATVQTVIAKFGPPNSSQLMPAGQRILTYSYSTVHTDAKSYIPVVGPLVGNSGFSIASASLIFDPDGTLASYTTNQNSFGSGASVTAAP